LLKAGAAAGASLALAGLACAAGCASLAPMAVKWGADLVSAAASNYSQQYSHQLEGLLLAVFTEQAAKRLPGASGSGQDAYPPSGAQGQPYPAASQPNPTQSDPYPPAGGSGSPYPTAGASSGSAYPTTSSSSA
jgi:F0F1-type ATP synthase membrane subunit c/vacuolar-type H+-ATPase subunit K